MQDGVLIDRAMRGDRAAFEEVVAQHQSAIYGYLRARLIQPTDADDLTQETFLRCYEARARFDSSAMLRPWLIGIARNLLREHIRRVRRRKEVAWTELCLELEEMVDFASDDHDAILMKLPKCLEGLGPSAREAVDLHYSGKMKISEIADKLCRSQGAVKLLMYRARQALKYCLDRKPVS